MKTKKARKENRLRDILYRMKQHRVYKLKNTEPIAREERLDVCGTENCRNIFSSHRFCRSVYLLGKIVTFMQKKCDAHECELEPSDVN